MWIKQSRAVFQSNPPPVAWWQSVINISSIRPVSVSSWKETLKTERSSNFSQMAPGGAGITSWPSWQCLLHLIGWNPLRMYRWLHQSPAKYYHYFSFFLKPCICPGGFHSPGLKTDIWGQQNKDFSGWFTSPIHTYPTLKWIHSFLHVLIIYGGRRGSHKVKRQNKMTIAEARWQKQKNNLLTVIEKQKDPHSFIHPLSG